MTKEDADSVKDHFTIAVNSTWKLAPWCDVLFAGDMRWWKSYGHEVDIPAMRISNSKTAGTKYGAAPMRRSEASNGSHNSGMLAIEWAIQKGATKVYLLGFDCSIENGTHHHGDHMKTPNPTEGRCHSWQKQFKRLAKHYPKAQIFNCSRETELMAFPLASLESVLESLD